MPTTQSDTDTSLFHPKEIKRGPIRLIYAPQTCHPACGPFKGHVLEAGWVLHGGARTDDQEFAQQYAEQAALLARRTAR